MNDSSNFWYILRWIDLWSNQHSQLFSFGYFLFLFPCPSLLCFSPWHFTSQNSLKHCPKFIIIIINIIITPTLPFLHHPFTFNPTSHDQLLHLMWVVHRQIMVHGTTAHPHCPTIATAAAEVSLALVVSIVRTGSHVAVVVGCSGCWSGGRHQICAQIPVTLLQRLLLQRIQSWLHTRTPKTREKPQSYSSSPDHSSAFFASLETFRNKINYVGAINYYD